MFDSAAFRRFWPWGLALAATASFGLYRTAMTLIAAAALPLNESTLLINQFALVTLVGQFSLIATHIPTLSAVAQQPTLWQKSICSLALPIFGFAVIGSGIVLMVQLVMPGMLVWWPALMLMLALSAYQPLRNALTAIRGYGRLLLLDLAWLLSVLAAPLWAETAQQFLLYSLTFPAFVMVSVWARALADNYSEVNEQSINSRLWANFTLLGITNVLSTGLVFVIQVFAAGAVDDSLVVVLAIAIGFSSLVGILPRAIFNHYLSQLEAAMAKREVTGTRQLVNKLASFNLMATMLVTILACGAASTYSLCFIDLVLAPFSVILIISAIGFIFLLGQLSMIHGYVLSSIGQAAYLVRSNLLVLMIVSGLMLVLKPELSGFYWLLSAIFGAALLRVVQLIAFRSRFESVLARWGGYDWFVFQC